jgi:hypothetical protein
VAQQAAIATPSIASTRSVERLGNENSPDSRSEWPRARWSIGAISRWFTATMAAAADRPASAYSTSDAGAIRRRPWKAAYAASIDSVQLQMLKIWMYQALRFFSHSGMCWTTPISTTSSGGRSIAAGMRNTIVVWYDWFRGVRTTNSCATAAIAPRMKNVVQPGVCGLRCDSSGTVTAIVTAATTKK